FEEFDFEFDIESIDYENINQKSELLKVEDLFKSLNLELKDFAKVYGYEISFEKLHFNELANTILAKKKIIKTSVWKSLQRSEIEKQALFLSEIDKLEDYYDFVENTSE